MTPSEILDTCRNRHNAANDTNWSDLEIYQLLTNRVNEALSYIGFVEQTSVSIVSVVGTEAYNYPTGAEIIENIDYNNRRLYKIDWSKYNLYKTRGSTQPRGTPTMFTVWANQILLVPIPSAAGDILKVRYYGIQSTIVPASTIVLPVSLHPHLVNGVLADMYAKDLNVQLYDRYQAQWQNAVDIAFPRFKSRETSAGQGMVINDCDTEGAGTV